MRTLLSISFVLASALVFGQGQKARYAEGLFSKMHYYDAAPVYAELVGQSSKSNTNYDYVSKAAASYYLQGLYSSALPYYEMLDAAGKLSDKELVEYIDVLLITGKQDKAYAVTTKNSQRLQYNRRALEMLRHKDLNYLKADSANFTIQELAINSGLGEFGPALFGDRLYFTSSRKSIGQTTPKYPWDNSNYLKVYSTGKLSSFDFSEVVLEKELVSKYHDGPVAISPDGTRLLITRNDYAAGDKKNVRHLVLVEYRLTNGKWSEFSEFPFNSADWNTGHAAFAPDGKTIYFVSDRPGGHGGSDIYKSVFNGSKWSEPVNAGPGINSDRDELTPFVTAGGDLYFSSNGFAGVGGFDIYKGSGDKEPVNIGYPLNSMADDISFTVDPKGEIGYFSSDRSAVDRIYGVRIKEVTGDVYLSVMNEFDREKIKDADVYLVNKTSGDTIRPVLNESGEYVAKIKKNQSYVAVAEKEDFYMAGDVSFETSNLKDGSVLPVDVLLKSDYIMVDLSVLDKETKEKLPNVTGYFKDPTRKELIKYQTDSLGNAIVKLRTDNAYDIFAAKKGYLDLNDSVRTSKTMVLELDLVMAEIKKDIKFEVKNILYDFAKYSLRTESTLELDKLADFLIVNDNIMVELSSHTDARGSDKANAALSQKRAESCVIYLISKGVKKENIIAKGYGEQQLLNRCKNNIECSEEEHQLNRRTEIKILEVME